MKNLLNSLLFVFGIVSISSAQFTEEKTYKGAEINLYMINLEVAGMKYITIHRGKPDKKRSFTLYNLDHSIWKHFDCNNFTTLQYMANQYSNYVGNDSLGIPIYETVYDTNWFSDFQLMYVSQHLFNTDDEVEFMYIEANQKWYTGIYNENGTKLFSRDSAAPLCRLNMPITMVPIYNTPQGTKMILSSQNGDATVYGLAGKLSGLIKGPDTELSSSSMFIYPNPSAGMTTVQLNMQGVSGLGKVEIHDMNGKLIKSYTVDNTFDDLKIDNSEFESGMYLYSLKVNGQLRDTKQIVIAK